MPIEIETRSFYVVVMSTDDINLSEQAALDYGIDLTLLHYKKSLSPTERLVEHQTALELMDALKQAGDQYYHEQSQRTPVRAQ